MKLLIIDDHALFREGLALLIEHNCPDATILGAGSLIEAQALAVNSRHIFDCVLLDLMLGEMEASKVTPEAIPMFPDTPIVVLSGVSDPRLMRGCIEAGAMGFIPKSLPFADFSAALCRSLAGEVYLPQMCIIEGLNVMKRDKAAQTGDADCFASCVARLSLRQLQILRLLVYGWSNRSIAQKLNISEGTVKTHMGRLLPALGVHSRSEAVYLLAQVEHSIGRNDSSTSKSKQHRT